MFFSKGFEDTTIQDVLDLAGVSKGGFYHHFKSKDELLFGVLDGMAEGVFAQMAVVASDEKSSALDLTVFLVIRWSHNSAEAAPFRPFAALFH